MTSRGLSRHAVALLALVALGCSGRTGTPDAPAPEPTAPRETCYAINAQGDELRVSRDASNNYTLVSTTLDATTFQFNPLQAAISVQVGINGYNRFDVALAPNGAIANAQYAVCVYEPGQSSCLAPMYSPALISTCEGAAVHSESIAGCYQKVGSMTRFTLTGGPGNYTAMVSLSGEPASAWDVQENSTAITLTEPGGPLVFGLWIGSTGRLEAYSYDLDFCANGCLFAPCG